MMMSFECEQTTLSLVECPNPKNTVRDERSAENLKKKNKRIRIWVELWVVDEEKKVRVFVNFSFSSTFSPSEKNI